MKRLVMMMLVSFSTFIMASIATNVWAEQYLGCEWRCNRLLTDGTLTSSEDYQQCVAFCKQVQTEGIEGVSIKCMYALPKACGYELAWDFIRYCFKPCAEFNEHECGKCLAKHSYCHKGTACHAKVCDCIIKHNCDDVLKKACNH